MHQGIKVALHTSTITRHWRFTSEIAFFSGNTRELYFQLLDLTALQTDAIFLVPRPKCAVIGPQAKQQKA